MSGSTATVWKDIRGAPGFFNAKLARVQKNVQKKTCEIQGLRAFFLLRKKVQKNFAKTMTKIFYGSINHIPKENRGWKMKERARMYANAYTIWWIFAGAV